MCRLLGRIAPVGGGPVRSGTNRARPGAGRVAPDSVGPGVAAVVVVESVARGFGVVRQHEVPTVAAVLAAVGDDVARQPLAVLARLGQQVAAAAAVDTGDRGLGLHTRSLAL